MSPPIPSMPPSDLAGRDRERKRLADLLAAASNGRGTLVLIGGEAGIGKTALILSLAAEAATLGGAVLVGHCWDLSSTPPYGPWRELLESPPFSSNLPTLPAALTDTGDAETGSQAVVFRQVQEILASTTSNRPLVVVLEDIHWADPASLELLRFLARQLPTLPILLIATYRTDEITRRHPLAQLLPTLVRESPIERIDLRRLDNHAIRALVANRYPLPEEAEDRLVAYLQHAADGNPFYAQELLRNLVEERILQPGNPYGTLGTLERVRVPALLQQVVEGRLARLGESTRDHLALAAVIGQRVPIDVWRIVGGLSEDEVLQAVDRAVEASLIEAGDDGTHVVFTHALVREVLHEGILPPRRRVWHRRVAEALAELPIGDPDAISYHFVQAGDPRAAGWLIRAGERAQRAYAWSTAAERLAAAAELTSGSSSGGERGWLFYRAGRLLRFADTQRSLAYLDEAEFEARAAGDQVLAAYAQFERGMLRVYRNESERGLAEMEAGDAALAALPPALAQLPPDRAEWVADATPRSAVPPDPAPDASDGLPSVSPRRGPLLAWLGFIGRIAAVDALGSDYLARLDERKHLDTTLIGSAGDAEFAMAHVHAFHGRPVEARAVLARARAHYDAIGHRFMYASTLSFELAHIVLPYQTDAIGERRHLADEAEEIYDRIEGVLQAGESHLMRPSLLLVEGAWEEARLLALAGLDVSRFRVRWDSFAVLACLGRHQGDPELAWEQVRNVLPRGPATEPGNGGFLTCVLAQRTAADLALDAGNPSQALEWLESHDRWLAWSGGVRGRAEGRLCWARYHRSIGDTDRARETARDAVTDATAPRQPLTLLAAQRILGEIETDAGNLTVADAYLTASLDLAEACAAPFERALSLLSLAELRAATGRFPEAARLLDEVRAIGQPLGALPMLSRANALVAKLASRPAKIDQDPRLSAREIEVLGLVAAGRSNPQIAEDLFLSPRTVTTHLTHIYAKLDVEGRAEAVAVALRDGLL